MEPVAVVIPTLNEAGTICDVIREILRGFAADIITADSGSTDITQTVATAAVANCRVIVLLNGDSADHGDLIGRSPGPVWGGTRDFVFAIRMRGQRERGSMLWKRSED
jgi:hypothetical protein